METLSHQENTDIEEWESSTAEKWDDSYLQWNNKMSYESLHSSESFLINDIRKATGRYAEK